MWLAHFSPDVGIAPKMRLSNNNWMQLSLLKINHSLNNFQTTLKLFIQLTLTETSSGIYSRFSVKLKIEVVEQLLKKYVAHQVRLEYIRAGHPATLDLWYPPRYITPPEYIRDLEHEEFLYRNIPVLLDNEEQQDETPVLQEAEQQEPIPVLQAAEPLEHIVVQIDYPRQFRRIVHRLIYIFLAILALYVL